MKRKYSHSRSVSVLAFVVFGYAVLYGVRLELQKLARDYDENKLTNRTFTNHTSHGWTFWVYWRSCEHEQEEVSSCLEGCDLILSRFLAIKCQHQCIIFSELTLLFFDIKCLHGYFFNIILKHLHWHETEHCLAFPRKKGFKSGSELLIDCGGTLSSCRNPQKCDGPTAKRVSKKRILSTRVKLVRR